MPTTDWTIISGGVSRASLGFDDLLEGPVVAINRAVDAPVLIDIWSVWDTPGLIPTPSILPRAVWVSELYAKVWAKRHPETEVVVSDLGPPLVRGGKVPSTLEFSIETAIRLGGQRIRVLAADMEGDWGASPEKEWDRWPYERERMALVVERALERYGVSVEIP